MRSTALGSLARRWIRAASIIGTFAGAVSCGDHPPVAPKAIAPGHSRLSLHPTFQKGASGGPTIDLRFVEAYLIGPTGDSIHVHADFVGDSAILVFDVPLSGGSTTYNLDVTAFDAAGQSAFHTRTAVTLKPGENTPASPQLIYSAADAALTTLHVSPGTLQLNAGVTSSLGVSGTTSANTPVTSIHVAWTSKDPNIASVDANGAVRAGILQGSTYIVARTYTNVADSALVRVKGNVAKVTVAPATLTIARGVSGVVGAELRDAANTLIDDRSATWTTSDANIATVSAAGVVQGIAVGTATITATAEGKTASAAVTVVSPLDHVELSPSSLTFASLGETQTIAARLVPVTNASVAGMVATLSSSDASVATVDANGVVTAKANGTATITASAEGKTASAAVTVRQLAATLSVSPTFSGVTSLGASRTFTASAADARGNLVTTPIAWSSSDDNVATVSGGVATGKSVGSATITAASGDKRASATFTVAQVPTLVLMSADRTTIQVGTGAQLRATYYDDGGHAIPGGAPGYVAVNPTIATVSATGRVTAISAGDATFTAGFGSITASIVIHVIGIQGGPPPAGGLQLNVTTVEKLPNGTQQFTVTDTSGVPPYTWFVNGVAGGNSTFGTITTSGFYTAPAAVPSPATFDVCAQQANPSRQGCAHVTINAVPSSGADIIVFNDINMFDNNYGSPYADNRKLFENLVSFTGTGRRASQNGILVHRGHSSRCGLTECRASDFSSMNAQLTSLGYTITNVDDQSATIGSIPSAIKVVMLLMPMTPYSNAEINELKSFAGTGGRIIFIGEREPYYGTFAGLPIENAFFEKMGAVMRNVGGDYACIYQMTASDIRPHQVTAGLNGLSMACASSVQLGPNDYALVTDRFNSSVVLAAVAKIDLTPLTNITSIRVSPAATADVRRNEAVPPDPNEHSWGRGPGVTPAARRP